MRREAEKKLLAEKAEIEAVAAERKAVAEAKGQVRPLCIFSAPVCT